MVKLGVIKKQFASDGMVGCSKLKQKLNNQTNRALEQLHGFRANGAESGNFELQIVVSIIQCTMCMAHISAQIICTDCGHTLLRKSTQCNLTHT